MFFVSKMHDIWYQPAAMTQFPVPIPDPIISAANAEVKSLRALHERKYRKKSGWFLAEGARICREAVALGCHPPGAELPWGGYVQWLADFFANRWDADAGPDAPFARLMRALAADAGAGAASGAAGSGEGTPVAMRAEVKAGGAVRLRAFAVPEPAADAAAAPATAAGGDAWLRAGAPPPSPGCARGFSSFMGLAQEVPGAPRRQTPRPLAPAIAPPPRCADHRRHQRPPRHCKRFNNHRARLGATRPAMRQR